MPSERPRVEEGTENKPTPSPGMRRRGRHTSSAFSPDFMACLRECRQSAEGEEALAQLYPDGCKAQCAMIALATLIIREPSRACSLPASRKLLRFEGTNLANAIDELAARVSDLLCSNRLGRAPKEEIHAGCGLQGRLAAHPSATQAEGR